MKRIILITISILSFTLVIILGIYTYIVFDYAKGEKEEFQNIFNSKKEYIVSLSFEGIIQKKTDKVLYNKNHRYLIELALDEFNPKPTVGERQFPTYYDFLNDSTLCLSVSEALFRQIEINQTIHKTKNDYTVIVNGDRLILLSNQKGKWFP